MDFHTEAGVEEAARSAARSTCSPASFVVPHTKRISEIGQRSATHGPVKLEGLCALGAGGQREGVASKTCAM